jgi:hypothetical protein
MPADQAPKGVSDLREEAAELKGSVSELAQRFDIASKQVQLLRRISVTLVAVVMVLIVSGVVIGVLLFLQVHRNNEFLSQGQQARGSIALIRDCIDPKGKCAQRQRQSTANAINSIVDTNGNGKPDTQEVLEELKKLQAGGR